MKEQPSSNNNCSQQHRNSATARTTSIYESNIDPKLQGAVIGSRLTRARSLRRYADFAKHRMDDLYGSAGTVGKWFHSADCPIGGPVCARWTLALATLPDLVAVRHSLSHRGDVYRKLQAA